MTHRPETQEIYRDGELVETRTVVVPMPPPDPTVALEAKVAELETRLADVPTAESVSTLAEAVDASLDPDATPGRKQTVRDRIREMLGLALTPPKTPPGKDKP